jgi:hypothetical protein
MAGLGAGVGRDNERGAVKMSDSDSQYSDPFMEKRMRYGQMQYEGGGGDNSGMYGKWVADEDVYSPTKFVSPNISFDPAQAASSGGIDYKGRATQFFDNSGGLSGYLGRDDQYHSVKNLPGFQDDGNVKATYATQKVDDDGNFVFWDPQQQRETLRDTGIHARGLDIERIAAQRGEKQGTESLFQDPLFRNFLLSAGAMGAAAAFAPSLAAGGAETAASSLAVPEGWVAAYEAALPSTMGEIGALGAAEGAGALSGALGAKEAAGLLGGLSKSELFNYGKTALGAIGSVMGGQSGGGMDIGKLLSSNQSGGQPYGALGSYFGAPRDSELVNATNKIDLPQFAQLKQLYPQLEQVRPDVMNSLLADQPAQQYQPVKFGGDSASSQNYNFDNFGEDMIPNFASGGDVKSHDHQPEFITGATGHYVQGRGDGQSDDIPAMLADGEFVLDADTVSALGNGSNKAGAQLLDDFRQEIRSHKRSAPSNKIPPKSNPLEYMRQAIKNSKE